MVARAELLVLVLLQAAATAAAWRAWKRAYEAAHSEKQRQLQTLEQELEKREKMRLDERKGRVAAEKELRRVMGEKLDTSKGYFVQSIGGVRSCFQTCLGTPRQGLLAPSTRGRIEFQRSISPDTLIGLSAFSHVWIVFVFHKNTNGKNSRAHSGLRSDSHRHTFRAKIAPPLLKERVGVFSTRSPHRPNPIGITLAKIESVDMKRRTVHLSGVDLVDGTPVLDIKPYVPSYDCLPDAHAAAWVTPDNQVRTEVHWQEPALIAHVQALASTSSHFRDVPDTFVRAIEEVLQVDVRSKEQTKRWSDSSAVSCICIDNARVEYSVELSDATTTTPTRIVIQITPLKMFKQVLKELTKRVTMATSVATPPNVPQAVESSQKELLGMASATGTSHIGSHSKPPLKEQEQQQAPSTQCEEPTQSSEQQHEETPAPAANQATPEEQDQSSSPVADTVVPEPASTLSAASDVMVSAASAATAPKLKKKAGGGGKKKKMKKSAAPSPPNAPCIGLYVDALDTKMLWSEAQIIDCNVAEKKIKVHFIGWKSRWDIWTDRMSVAGHGTFVPLGKKGLAQTRRWDGQSNLFSNSSESEQSEQAPSPGDVLVPLVKDDDDVPVVVKTEKKKLLRVTTLDLSAPPAAAASVSIPTPTPRATTPAAGAARKARSPKTPAAAPTERSSSKRTSAAGPVPKRSPTIKSERTSAVVPVAKATAPPPTGSGKKRSKPVVPAAAAVSSTSATKRSATTTATATPRAPKRARETTLELLPVDGAALVDFAATRRAHVTEDEQTARFLQTCAGVWQRQLSVMAARHS